MPRAVLLLAAATRALAQTGTPGLATYATTLGPSPSFVDPYKSASYAGGVANAAIKTGLAGKTFRVAASYYDLSAGATGGTYEVDALSWVTPSPAALTAFAALPVGSALLLNKSDVTGTGPCLLNLICAQASVESCLQYTSRKVALTRRAHPPVRRSTTAPSNTIGQSSRQPWRTRQTRQCGSPTC
jgi:hypothetical protein